MWKTTNYIGHRIYYICKIFVPGQGVEILKPIILDFSLHFVAFWFCLVFAFEFWLRFLHSVFFCIRVVVDFFAFYFCLFLVWLLFSCILTVLFAFPG